MKSYNNLYDKFISDENIELAIHNAFKGKKRHRRDVQEATSDMSSFIDRVKDYASHFKNAKHRPKSIYDGISRKKRTIIIPSMMEQVVHHMLCNVLIPLISPSMYEHSYASLPGKGATLGKWYIEKMIRKGKDIKYYLKMDIKKFFNSIPHDKLFQKLARIIKDRRFLDVLFKVIDVIPRGLPLGFYTSQWLANFYLTGLDHRIKEQDKAPFYYRYMDDMVLFKGSKRWLHKEKDRIVGYLEELGLQLKENWQVVLFSYPQEDGKDPGRDLDFMGYRFFRNRTIIRKSILRKARRKALRVLKNNTYTIYECRQMLSYVGYFKRTNTHRYWNKYIKPCVNIEGMKRRISAWDRRRNNEQRNLVQGRMCEYAAATC